MKSLKYTGVLLLTTAFSISAYAKDNQLTIVNHFDQPLNFKVGLQHEVLPDLPVTFKLDINEQVVSKVLDLKKQAYIRTTGDTEEKSAFWGVEVVNDMTHIHGYVSKSIAYSWKMETIIFCTPEEYKQKGSCF